MKIFTVYRPEEHVDYLEEWIKYHLQIGVKHFYLYDNGGSVGYGPKKNNIHWDDILHTDSKNGISRYGFKIKYTSEEARLKENKFINNYPVTKILWQPVVDDKIVYGYNDAVIDFTSKVKSGLCAFIDIDEFIVKKEEFRPSRMYQRIFKDYHYFNSIFDCKETTTLEGLERDMFIRLLHESSKCILDLANFPDLDSVWENTIHPNTMHFLNTSLPLSQSHFNHYNFNKLKYVGFRNRATHIGHKWKVKPYQDCTVLINNPFE